MIRNSVVEAAIVNYMPDLRAFAISLCRNRAHAEDLVQETLTRAIAHIGTFREGSNLAAWLTSILRNTFYNEIRNTKWLEHDSEGLYARSMATLPDQDGWEITEDLRAALGTLSSDHQEALYLVGASGLSYDEAATVAGCPTGTMKSRVSRARTMLAAFMSENRA